jgi:sigma-B regulation protein RsbU (phosphoserine phosphatase)
MYHHPRIVFSLQLDVRFGERAYAQSCHRMAHRRGTMEPEPANGRLLIVDDDPAVRQTNVRVLSQYAPLQAEDGIAARDILSSTEVDVVICDLEMPRLNGLDLMRWAKDHCTRPLWIVLSAQDTFDAASQALKLGAFDFICKPTLPIQLRMAVANAIRHQELLRERANLMRDLAENNVTLADSLGKLEAANEVLREQQSMLNQDFQRAGRIMKALLPQSLPSVGNIQLNVGYRASHVIGGDLYGAAMLDDRLLAVYVADAAGHGVSAALLAVLFKQRLRLFEAGSGPRAPAAVLSDLNHALFDECRASGLFVTVTIALVDTSARTATVASAGHPPALILRGKGATERIEKTGPALGLVRDATFEERQLSLRAGDRLFLYTDGLTSALARGGIPMDAIVSAIRTAANDGPKAIDHLLALTERSGTSDDDVTLLLLTEHGGACTIDTDRETTPAATSAECILRIGSIDDTTWIALEGRATWKHGPAMRDACLRALDRGRSAIIDLGACTMLDSTLLGTLHDLVAISPSGSLRLQNVSEELRDLLVELTMTQVLSSVVDAPQPLPTEMASIVVKGDAGANGLVLRAHELLARLSPQNAEEFGPVVDALRRG